MADFDELSRVDFDEFSRVVPEVGGLGAGVGVVVGLLGRRKRGTQG
jgi:hypothetical protein